MRAVKSHALGSINRTKNVEKGQRGTEKKTRKREFEGERRKEGKRGNEKKKDRREGKKRKKQKKTEGKKRGRTEKKTRKKEKQRERRGRRLKNDTNRVVEPSPEPAEGTSIIIDFSFSRISSLGRRHQRHPRAIVSCCLPPRH
jgi:hypothetical protein